jgi:hypothetical protein
VGRDQCRWCSKIGHYQKDCSEFLKQLNKKDENHITFVNESGENHITFVNESLYLRIMQNLLGGLTQVQLFILSISYWDFVRGGPCKEKKEGLESSTASRLKLKR